MPHPTSQGLSQECGALIELTKPHLPELEKRNVTQVLLDKYAAQTKTMEETVAAAGGKTSDKEQLTAGEFTARHELLADVRKMQGGAKRTFPRGSPQLKEFFVGDKFNGSTAMLLKWANGIAGAWTKYSASLIETGNLIQADVDTMVANASLLRSVDSAQEAAKHADVPEATAASQKAMDDVSAIADFIYGAASAEYARNPQLLGEFEKLKPLRYAVPRPPKNPPTAPPPDAPKT